MELDILLFANAPIVARRYNCLARLHDAHVLRTSPSRREQFQRQKRVICLSTLLLAVLIYVLGQCFAGLWIWAPWAGWVAIHWVAVGIVGELVLLGSLARHRMELGLEGEGDGLVESSEDEDH